MYVYIYMYVNIHMCVYIYISIYMVVYIYIYFNCGDKGDSNICFHLPHKWGCVFFSILLHCITSQIFTSMFCCLYLIHLDYYYYLHNFIIYMFSIILACQSTAPTSLMK